MHDAFWGMRRAQLGDAAGTRVLVEVLLLHRHLPAADLTTGMTTALRLQAPSADVVAVAARKTGGQPDPGPVPLALKLSRRVPARDDAERVVVLPSDPRPLPTVDQYEQLLSRRFQAAFGAADKSVG